MRCRGGGEYLQQLKNISIKLPLEILTRLYHAGIANFVSIANVFLVSLRDLFQVGQESIYSPPSSPWGGVIHLIEAMLPPTALESP